LVNIPERIFKPHFVPCEAQASDWAIDYLQQNVLTEIVNEHPDPKNDKSKQSRANPSEHRPFLEA